MKFIMRLFQINMLGINIFLKIYFLGYDHKIVLLFVLHQGIFYPYMYIHVNI